MRQRRYVHLKGDAREAAQRVAVPLDLLDDLIGAADEQRASGTTLRVKARARDRPPSTLLPDIGQGASVAREKRVGGFLGGLRHVTERVDADLQLIRRMSESGAGFAI